MNRIIDEIIDKIDLDFIKKLNINNYDEKINNLQMKIIEMEINIGIISFGEFEWKIDDLYQQGRRIFFYSESFYSHKNGYKMCLSVFIGGDYNYVLVGFHLVRGEFDNDLLWPFKHAITIDIINQINGGVDRSRTIKYDDNQYKERLNKPTTEINDSIQFNRIINPKEIIRNNQMLIKCKINI